MFRRFFHDSCFDFPKTAVGDAARLDVPTSSTIQSWQHFKKNILRASDVRRPQRVWTYLPVPNQPNRGLTLWPTNETKAKGDRSATCPRNGRGQRALTSAPQSPGASRLPAPAHPLCRPSLRPFRSLRRMQGSRRQ
jgi:hypothetical protein